MGARKQYIKKEWHHHNIVTPPIMSWRVPAVAGNAISIYTIFDLSFLLRSSVQVNVVSILQGR